MDILELCADINNNIDSLDRKELYQKMNMLQKQLKRFYPPTHYFITGYWNIRQALNYMNNNNQDYNIGGVHLNEIKKLTVSFLDCIINEVNQIGHPDDKVWADFVVDVVEKEMKSDFNEICSAATLYTDDKELKMIISEVLFSNDRRIISNSLAKILTHPCIVDRLKEKNKNMPLVNPL